MAKEAAHLALLGVVLFLFFTCCASSCIDVENIDLDPRAPSLTINTVEFPDENVIRIGSNITIQCISNLSKEYFGNRYYGQPYWIQFYYNDKIPGIKECGGSGRVDSEDSKVCSFFIQNATKNDSGVYSCWARNQISCTRGKIKLEFKAPSAPIVTSNAPYEIYVSAGGKANWTCEALGVPVPLVKWYKDGIPVPRKNTTKMKGHSTLIVEAATTLHEGEYWCEARNSEGWKRSPSTILTLKRMPTISRHPKNVSVYLEGDVTMVSFSCKATGSPPPVVGWLKNNSTKANGTVIQTGSISSLILILAEKEKTAGTYNCVAKNSAGEAYSSEGKLEIFTQRPNAEVVRQRISFYSHPDNITVSPGDRVVFTCAVEGSSVPTVTWLKDGMKSMYGEVKTFQGKGSSTSVLTISSVEEQHVGNYACQATETVENVTSRVAKLTLTGDLSTSTDASELMWVLVGAAAVLLVVVLILIFVIHNKYKKAAFEITAKEIKEEERYTNLYFNEDAICQQLNYNKSCAAPRYQMKNMATKNAA